MKIYVYFLSLLLVIAPIYANAVPFLPAIVGHATGEIAVGTGKAIIKKMPTETKKQLSKGAVSICAKNTTIATFCGGVMSAILGNDWTIENNNTTNNNDIDINVYQKNQDICSKTTIFYDRFDQNYRQENAHRYKTDKSEVFFEYFSQNYKSDRNVTYSYSNLRFEPSDTAIFEFLKKNSYTQVKSIFTLTTKSYTGKVDVNDKANLMFYAFKLDENHACFSKSRVSDDDLVNIFNSLSDDDVANIYNYDYSQHNVITVNNVTTSGDNINNSKNNFDENYNEKKLSESATNKMKSGDRDYTIDNINDENCKKNDDDEYDKCGSDRDSEDTDNSDDDSSSDDETETDDENKEKDDDKFCNSNEFYKKICDWIDWTQDDYQSDDDTKVEIKDGTDDMKLDDDMIKFEAKCPPPKQVSISVAGYSIQLEWSFELWCSTFTKLKPFLIGLSGISSVLIITGVRKNG